MNYLKSLFCVLLSLTLIVSSSSAKKLEAASSAKPETKVETDDTAKAQSNARVEFLNPVQDFGQVSPKSVHEFEYKFKNVGTEKLIVSHVQSTCGCTVPALAKKEYAPGEEGAIKVKYTSPSREGSTTKKVYFHSNDAVNPRFGLMIKSNTILKVSVEPKRLELSLADKGCGMIPIKIFSKDSKPFSILSVEGSVGGLLTAKFDKKAKNNEFILEPVVNAKKLAKNLNGIIRIKIDHPDCKEVTLTYTTKPKYHVSPARILFLKAKPGATQEREVRITSNYTDTIEIESMKAKKGLITVEKQDIDGSVANLKVVLTAPKITSKQRFFSDSLLIKLKGGENIEVKCNGWFKKDVFNAAIKDLK